MATKTIKKKEEDFLGLVAFGSLITNIFQIASKKSLEVEHEALKAYASELKRLYENIKMRERQIYKENLELKRANEELIVINNRLLKELIETKNENIKLKEEKSTSVVRRIRRISKTNEGTK